MILSIYLYLVFLYELKSKYIKAITNRCLGHYVNYGLFLESSNNSLRFKEYRRISHGKLFQIHIL